MIAQAVAKALDNRVIECQRCWNVDRTRLTASQICSSMFRRGGGQPLSLVCAVSLCIDRAVTTKVTESAYTINEYRLNGPRWTNSIGRAWPRKFSQRWFSIRAWLSTGAYTYMTNVRELFRRERFSRAIRRFNTFNYSTDACLYLVKKKRSRVNASKFNVDYGDFNICRYISRFVDLWINLESSLR